MIAVTMRHPFANVSWATWWFALRSWAAIVLALYAAFWLQLDDGSGAAVTVAILAAPTRGAAFDKALYRIVGTLVGIAAALAITGLLNETRTLFLAALSLWFALCVFVAGLLDGNRAYAASLSGYTVAIVAVPTIDSPLQTFAAAADRGASIVIGIIALTLVFDLFATPDSLPNLIGKIAAAHAKATRFVMAAARGDPPGEVALAALCSEITTLRAGALALPRESLAGAVRSAAARQALASLAAMVHDARRLSTAPGELRERLASALASASDADRTALLSRWARHPGGQHASAARLLAHERAVGEALARLSSGQGPEAGPALPIHHPVGAARRNALRTLVAFASASVFFVVTGWPETTEGLLHIAIFTCISIANPRPYTYAYATVYGTILVIVAVGVTEFLLLDGTDAFPLLAIMIAPVIIPMSMMKISKNVLVAAMGQRALIFFFLILSPSLTQSYDAQAYISSCVILLTSAVFFVATRIAILPLRPDLRIAWLLAAARRRADAAPGGCDRDEEEAYWWADLIAQVGALARGGEGRGDGALREVVRLADAT